MASSTFFLEIGLDGEKGKRLLISENIRDEKSAREFATKSIWAVLKPLCVRFCESKNAEKAAKEKLNELKTAIKTLLSNDLSKQIEGQ